MITDIPHTIRDALDEFRTKSGSLVVITGAGISAESGIPTFRGPEGYWTLGAREYTPQEMATLSMFRRQPEAVWAWYLYRIARCQHARPNAAHTALVSIERSRPDQFVLITQNVDGLHREAGSSRERTYEIHGNIRQVRCSQECSNRVLPFPLATLSSARSRGEPLSPEELESLHCDACGAWLRPHVLWFDESYDDLYYHLTSSLAAIEQADLVWIIGTSGSTNLPLHLVRRADQLHLPIIEVNIARTAFSTIAERSEGGFLEATATEGVGELARLLGVTG